MLVVIRVFSFFSEREHTKNADGKIIFSNSNIQVLNSTIKWEKIIKIAIKLKNIKGEFDVSLSLENDVPDGINEILIISDSTEINAWLRLHSAHEKDALINLFTQFVEDRKVSYDVAKELIKPKNYQEIQLLKKHLLP